MLLVLAFLAAPANAADWSGEVGVVSDYRYRGLSLSDSKPALQASFSLAHGSGAYAEAWGSSLAPDDGSPIEIDGTIGYALDLTDTLSADLSVTYYAFPGEAASNAVEFSGSLEATSGPLTASVAVSVAPPQRGTRDDFGRRRANTYASGGVSYQLGRLPILVRARAGYERGPWDMAADGDKWDWSVGAELELTSARLGFDFVASDVSNDACIVSLALRF
jgi:uncharacterized protein (TIGR02001 family)